MDGLLVKEPPVPLSIETFHPEGAEDIVPVVGILHALVYEPPDAEDTLRLAHP